MLRPIRITREYAHPVQQLWFALTSQEALASWLMPNTFEAKLHHRFEFYTSPQLGFDGVVQCEIIEIFEPTLLAYSWQGGPMKRPTTVRWELEEISATHTRLTLEHSGFEGMSGVLVKAILNFGWKNLLHNRLNIYFSQR